ncbi:ABC-type glutathione transport system ATPase component [Rhizobium rosettiformans]|uniref:ABC-type glutathione transport system ATPase component n=1 Tax=Rhizobium rosettiformans TaxID=1368430 RepID=A0A7W8HUW6_9HYPH|nr:ABC-type glutathione transport system ATPase component [Rhizobium rosettiformans]
MDILRVENLEKDYEARAVGPVSFRLRAGEIGLIVGGSGSGKSTWPAPMG